MRFQVFCSALCGIALFARSAAAAEWRVIPHQGRDYVSFANVSEFYQFPEYTRASGSVILRGERRGIRAQSGASELYINGVRFFTEFPIVSQGNDDLISAMDVSKIIEPVLRPNRLPHAGKVDTVVLDPGHGGPDNGAANLLGNEKTFALDVAFAARTQLLRAGFKVEMTRTTDVGLSLDERVSFANKFPNAVFVSIHFNSSIGGSGIESYALAPAGVPSNASTENHVSAGDLQAYSGNVHDEENMALTAAIHAAVLARIPVFDRGVRHARFHVLREIKIPGVLLEGGFLSNAFEAQRIATAQYRLQIGTAIAQALQNYNAAVNFRVSTFASAATSLRPHERSITEALSDEPAPRGAQTSQPSVVITGGN